jgi:hypothetical protein
MSLVEKVVAQFARPTGFWGNIAGFIMAHRPSNLERNEWAVSLERFARYLEMAGFIDIKVERKLMKPVSTVYVQGRNPQ